MKLLLARLQNRRLALPLASVERVILRPRLEVLPDLPAWLAGFLQLPGETLPVLDVGALFEGQRCPWDLYNPIVITRDEGNLALLFTAVEGLVEIPPEDFRPLQPDDSFQGVAAALIPRSQEWAPIIVPKLLLIAQEQRKLEHWRDILNQRVERLR
ncbi:MAG: chemotaxis protein CheW [Candidatus Eremiobacteraeota bacterium]|nr:chemotaxis protein CheW [Candidatus Eremiobacteraeota bacterium]